MYLYVKIMLFNPAKVVFFNLFCEEDKKNFVFRET